MGVLTHRHLAAVQEKGTMSTRIEAVHSFSHLRHVKQPNAPTFASNICKGLYGIVMPKPLEAGIGVSVRMSEHPPPLSLATSH